MLKKRIEVLQQGNIISEFAANNTLQILKVIQEEVPDLEEEKATVFITHLAMASQRILNKEEVFVLDDASKEELASHPSYEKVKELIRQIRKVSEIEFPEEEIDFFKVHLCNLYSE